MKKEIIIDVTKWRCFGFDALCSRSFYEKLADKSSISGSFHDKYDNTITSAASYNRIGGDKIMKDFDAFFDKVNFNTFYNDKLADKIRMQILLFYIKNYLKLKFFKKYIPIITDVDIFDFAIGDMRSSSFELVFTCQSNVSEEELIEMIEEKQDLNTPVIHTEFDERFGELCGKIMDIIIEESFKKLSPDFSKHMFKVLKG